VDGIPLDTSAYENFEDSIDPDAIDPNGCGAMVTAAGQLDVVGLILCFLTAKASRKHLPSLKN